MGKSLKVVLNLAVFDMSVRAWHRKEQPELKTRPRFHPVELGRVFNFKLSCFGMSVIA
jgi:hypothetical protein